AGLRSAKSAPARGRRGSRPGGLDGGRGLDGSRNIDAGGLEVAARAPTEAKHGIGRIALDDELGHRPEEGGDLVASACRQIHPKDPRVVIAKDEIPAGLGADAEEAP